MPAAETEAKSIRLESPADVHQHFRVEAAKEGKSMAAVARQLVEVWLRKRKGSWEVTVQCGGGCGKKRSSNAMGNGGRAPSARGGINSGGLRHARLINEGAALSQTQPDDIDEDDCPVSRTKGLTEYPRPQSEEISEEDGNRVRRP